MNSQNSNAVMGQGGQVECRTCGCKNQWCEGCGVCEGCETCKCEGGECDMSYSLWTTGRGVSGETVSEIVDGGFATAADAIRLGLELAGEGEARVFWAEEEGQGVVDAEIVLDNTGLSMGQWDEYHLDGEPGVPVARWVVRTWWHSKGRGVHQVRRVW